MKTWKAWLTVFVIAMFGALVWKINTLHFSHPPSHEIEGFKYLVQPDGITCGPTSATMLLNRYGRNVTVQQVKHKTKTQWFTHEGKAIGMTSPEYIPIALNHFGVPAKMRRGYLNRLKHYVSQDRPCIVLLRSGNQYWHYVVVIGYDQNSVLVADPGSGHREQINNEAFVGSWSFNTDMRGNETKNELLVEALRMAEVHPYTMIVPGIHIDGP